MTEKDDLPHQQTDQSAQLHVWLICKICSLLGLFALLAITRVPHYLAAAEYVQLTGIILFCLVLLVGVLVYLYAHTYHQRQTETVKGV